MSYTVQRQTPVSTVVRVGNLAANDEQWFLLCSDLHIDSPKCDRKLLARHMEQALERNAGILINGDIFDVMQSRNDRRRAHGAKLLKYLGGSYFNEVIDDVTGFLEPYAENFVWLGKGNHETAIETHADLDLLTMLYTRLSDRVPGFSASIGDYEAFIKFAVKYRTTHNRQFIMYAHHGSGGNSPVTRGVINFQRIAEYVPQAEIVWLGHIHQKTTQPRSYFYVGANGEVSTRERQFIRTGTYKKDNFGKGWAREKGFPPSGIGSYWLRFYVTPEGPKVMAVPTD